MLDNIDNLSIMKNMKPKELQAWRAKHGFSQVKLSKALRVDVMTVSRWERGLNTIPPYLPLALKCMIKQAKSGS